MILEYNLQFFAKSGEGGEKTEEPTAKKMEDSRKDGSVAKSKELANAISLWGLFVTIRFGMGYVGPRLIETFSLYYGKISTYITGGFSATAAMQVVRHGLLDVMVVIAPFMIVGLAIGFLGNKIQFKWMVTAKPMQPKLNKINPLNGFKRIFSVRSVVELLKSLIMIGFIGYSSYTVLMGHLNELFLLYDMSINQALALLGDIIWKLGVRICLIMSIVGLADYIFQRWKHKDDLKMTKQEVKDEYKNTEGDPQVKGRIKQRMREASMRRMMAAVPEADVVITNPTHFAVALKYERGKDNAPVVIAKGADFMAQRIKEVAGEHKIEIVEDRALARMLYYNVDLDQEIPPELYQAVADILAYVYHLKDTREGRYHALAGQT